MEQPVPVSARRASLDYSRFDAVVAEGSPDEEDDHPPGTLRWEEAYEIAHRCAGVIEDIRSSPLPSERKEDLLSRAQGVLDCAASATEAGLGTATASEGSGGTTRGREPIIVQSGPLGPPCRVSGEANMLQATWNAGLHEAPVREQVQAHRREATPKHDGDTHAGRLDAMD